MEYTENKVNGEKQLTIFESEVSSINLEEAFKFDKLEKIELETPDKLREYLKKVSCFQDFNNI